MYQFLSCAYSLSLDFAIVSADPIFCAVGSRPRISGFCHFRDFRARPGGCVNTTHYRYTCTEVVSELKTIVESAFE